jgi:uncharacterized protein (TIGR00725 family)
VSRRGVVSVIGSGDAGPEMVLAAEALGEGLIDLGWRLCTGGRGGVMAAALRGAGRSPRRREGDTLAILPGTDPAAAAPGADLVLPTGLGDARNALVVAVADVVVLVGGAWGALSELGLARKLGRRVIVVEGTGGVADGLPGLALADPGVERAPGVAAALVALGGAPGGAPA